MKSTAPHPSPDPTTVNSHNLLESVSGYGRGGCAATQILTLIPIDFKLCSGKKSFTLMQWCGVLNPNKIPHFGAQLSLNWAS